MYDVYNSGYGMMSKAASPIVSRIPEGYQLIQSSDLAVYALLFGMLIIAYIFMLIKLAMMIDDNKKFNKFIFKKKLNNSFEEFKKEME